MPYSVYGIYMVKDYDRNKYLALIPLNKKEKGIL